MKKGYIEVEFLHPCLSCGNAEDGGMDLFQRASDGSIIWSQSWWHAVLSRARAELELDNLNISDIQLSLSVVADTAPYNRKYGRNKFRCHEAILTGTQVKFDFAIKDRVTLEELKTMFEHIGKFIGISPYGYNLGYGKFKLLDVVAV
jgi:hypothetical protein